MRRTLLWFKRYSLLIVWLVFLAWMCHDYFTPDPPAVVSSYYYDQDRQLEQVIMVTSYGEFSMLDFILRPRAINRYSISRILGALCLSSFMMSVFAPHPMHSSNVLVIHYWWLWSVNVMLIVGLAISSISVALRFLRRPAQQE